MKLQVDSEKGFSVALVLSKQAWTKSFAHPLTTGVTVDSEGKLYFCAGPVLYCVKPEDGEILWQYEAEEPFHNVRPLVAPDGTVCVLTTNYLAINPGGTLKWMSLGIPGLQFQDPLRYGSDGSYYLLLKHKMGQPVALMAQDISNGSARWVCTLPRRCTSVPAVADGVLYLGCDDGALRAVNSSTGAVLWSYQTEGTIPAPPAVAQDGTIYFGLQHPTMAENAIVALSPTTREPIWIYKCDSYLNEASTITLGPSGRIYVGFEELRVISPRGQLIWQWLDDDKDLPDDIIVDEWENVFVRTGNGKIWAFDFMGNLLWIDPHSLPDRNLALGKNGELYYANSEGVLVALDPSPTLPPALMEIYRGLVSTRTQIESSNLFKIEVNSTSIKNANVLSLIAQAMRLTASNVTIEGDGARELISIASGQIIVHGVANVLGITAAKVSLTFGVKEEAQDVVVVSCVIAPAQSISLNVAFSELQGTAFAELPMSEMSIASHGDSASEFKHEWTFEANAPIDGFLKPAADFLGLTESQHISGEISFVEDKPKVTSKIGQNKFPVAFSDSYTLPMELCVSFEQVDGRGESRTVLKTQVGLGEHPVVIEADIRNGSGLIFFKASFPNGQQVQASDLAFWPSAAPDFLTQTLPAQLREGLGFIGLKVINLVVTRDRKKISSIGFVLGMRDWTALDTGIAGTTITVKNVEFHLQVQDPLGQKKIQAALVGTVETLIATTSGSQAMLSLDVGANAPDYRLWGRLTPDTTFKPSAMIGAMIGTPINIPSGFPDPELDSLEVSVFPKYGSFHFRAGGDLNWKFFEVNGQEYGFSNFAIELSRVGASPLSTAREMSVALFGTLSLSSVDLHLFARKKPGNGGWSFSTYLGTPVALPTVGELIAFFKSSWSEALPAPISSLGKNISLKEFELELPSGTEEKSLRAVIGTAPRNGEPWSWTPMLSPIEVSFQSVDIEIDVKAEQGVSGWLRAKLAIGSGAMTVQTALPFNKNTYRLAYNSKSGDSALPSVKDLASKVGPSWTFPNKFPDTSAQVKSNQLAFEIDVTPEIKKVTASISALNDSPWVFIGTEQNPILSLSKIGFEFEASKSEGSDQILSKGSIAGTVGIKSGEIPMLVAMRNSWSSYRVELDTRRSAVMLPTVGDLVGLVSESLANKLPSAISSLGKNIGIKELFVEVSDNAKSFSCSVEAVGTPEDRNPKWQPIPGVSGFTLQNLGIKIAGPLAGSVGDINAWIKGAIIIGDHGRIGLQARMPSTLNSVFVQLDEVQSTLPTVGDIAGLFSSAWARALPDSISTFGESVYLNQFDLKYENGPWSIEVGIGTKPGWEFQPIPGFNALIFKGASVGFTNSSTRSLKGWLKASAYIIGMNVDFMMILPDKIFVGRTGDFNIKSLCSFIIGSDSVPDFLEKIGFSDASVTVDLSKTDKKTIKIEGRLGSFNMGPLGDLEDITLIASFGDDGDPRACLACTWDPPVGSDVDIELCYPFKLFVPKKPGKPPSGPPMPFPPPVPPPFAPGEEDDREPAYATIEQEVAALWAAGYSIEAIMTILWYRPVRGSKAMGAMIKVIGEDRMTEIAAAAVKIYPDYKGDPNAAPADPKVLRFVADLKEAMILAGKPVLSLIQGFTALRASYSDITIYSAIAILQSTSGIVIDIAALVAIFKSVGVDGKEVGQTLVTLKPDISIDEFAQAFRGIQGDDAFLFTAKAFAGAKKYSPQESARKLIDLYQRMSQDIHGFAKGLLEAGFEPEVDKNVLAKSLSWARFSAYANLFEVQACYPDQIVTPVDGLNLLKECARIYEAASAVQAMWKLNLHDLAATIAAVGYNISLAMDYLSRYQWQDMGAISNMSRFLISIWPDIAAYDMVAALNLWRYSKIDASVEAYRCFPKVLEHPDTLAQVLLGALQRPGSRPYVNEEFEVFQVIIDTMKPRSKMYYPFAIVPAVKHHSIGDYSDKQFAQYAKTTFPNASAMEMTMAFKAVKEYYQRYGEEQFRPWPREKVNECVNFIFPEVDPEILQSLLNTAFEPAIDKALDEAIQAKIIGENVGDFCSRLVSPTGVGITDLSTAALLSVISSIFSDHDLTIVDLARILVFVQRGPLSPEAQQALEKAYHWTDTVPQVLPLEIFKALRLAFPDAPPWKIMQGFWIALAGKGVSVSVRSCIFDLANCYHYDSKHTFILASLALAMKVCSADTEVETLKALEELKIAEGDDQRIEDLKRAQSVFENDIWNKGLDHWHQGQTLEQAVAGLLDKTEGTPADRMNLLMDVVSATYGLMKKSMSIIPLCQAFKKIGCSKDDALLALKSLYFDWDSADQDLYLRVFVGSGEKRIHFWHGEDYMSTWYKMEAPFFTAIPKWNWNGRPMVLVPVNISDESAGYYMMDQDWYVSTQQIVQKYKGDTPTILLTRYKNEAAILIPVVEQKTICFKQHPLQGRGAVSLDFRGCEGCYRPYQEANSDVIIQHFSYQFVE